MNTPAASAYGLIADIGGTNCRLATVDLSDPTAKPDNVRKFKVAEHEHVFDAARIYLDECGKTTAPDTGVFAVAGPVTDNRIKFTNSDWAFSGEMVAEALGARKIELVNDFTAKAMSLSHLSEEDLSRIGPAVEGGENPLGYKVYAVVGPGTGLGVGGLLLAEGREIALDTEGGHMGFAPQTDEEGAVNKILRQRFGRVSNERILSGEGLKDLYEALSEVRGLDAHGHHRDYVTNLALVEHEPLAIDTLTMFCGILGAVAGDVALTIGAQGGVFIGGGIVPKMIDFFRSSPFRTRFEDKGRFKSFMQSVPTHVITAESPALLGCAAHLRHI